MRPILLIFAFTAGITGLHVNFWKELREKAMCKPTVVTNNDRKDFDFPKVELHLHVDGAIRFETILDVSRSRGIPVKDPKTGKIATTVEEVKAMLVTHEPANLAKVLEPYDIFIPVFKGDAVAIERIAYELCEDQSKNGVIYFEGRYSPYLLTDERLSSRDVVLAIHKGFVRGERDFGVKARSILCLSRRQEDHVDEVMPLVSSMSEFGVVGLDVTSLASGAYEPYKPSIVAAFKEAHKRGIHRTVHAGESGGPDEILKAITDMHAERIGHGYRVMRDPQMYKSRFVENKEVHLEACPYSSVMTGAVKLDWKHHPIVQWASDDVNFSLSQDNPTLFDNTILSELALARIEMSLTNHQLWKTQLNGARSCFLPEDEKAELVARIMAAEPKN